MPESSDPPDDGAADNGRAHERPRPDYEVGFGRPPLHSRFPPGKSGNPRGRKPGARGLRSELREELSERVTVTQDGRTRRLSKRRVILKALAAKAAKGDVRAADRLISLIIQMEGFEDRRETRAELSENDRRILEVLLGEGLPGDSSVETVNSAGPAPGDDESAGTQIKRLNASES